MLELTKVSSSNAGQAHICLPCPVCWPYFIIVCSPWIIAKP